MNHGHDTTVFLFEQRGQQQRHNDNNMLRSNRTRLPADVFSIGDRVKCVNPRSKHYAHTALSLAWARLDFMLSLKTDIMASPSTGVMQNLSPLLSSLLQQTPGLHPQVMSKKMTTLGSSLIYWITWRLRQQP